MKDLEQQVLERMPSPDEERAVLGRVWNQVEQTGGRIPDAVLRDVQRPLARRQQRTRVVLMGAAAAVLALAVGTAILWPRGDIALYRLVDGTVQTGDTIQTNGGGAQLALVDGSRVEMRSQSELSLERADDGLRIRLSKGGIIVHAAQQRTGHLYVQTKDVTVSVVGTVFLVNAGEDGSRVAVIEGEVRVQQGAIEKKLLPGDHVTTSPLMPSPPVKEAIAWSRNAQALLSLLQQSAVIPAAVTPEAALTPQTPAEPRLAFEEVSIRPRIALPGGRGSAPADAGCGDPTLFQLDPRRLAINGVSLNRLVVLAYPELAAAWGGCFGASTANILSGGAGWTRTDLWDIEAVIPEGPVDYKVTTTTTGVAAGRTVVQDVGPRVRAMLQTLLAERFRLVLRRETKEMSVYLLTVAGDGFKPNGSPSWAMLNGKPMMLNGQPLGQEGASFLRRITDRDRGPYLSRAIWKTPMADVAALLVAAVNRPVLDRTNLTGEYDFHLEYDPNGVTRPSLSTALGEVGLRLEDARVPVEMWVVERAERPSEN